MASHDFGVERERVDWARCSDVERSADTVSGRWRLKGTRIPVEDLLVNAEDQSPEQIAAEVYPSLSVDRIERVIAYARRGGNGLEPVFQPDSDVQSAPR